MPPGAVGEVIGNDPGKGLFQGGGGETPPARIRAARDQAVGDVVAQTLALAVGVGRRQHVAGLVPQLALERRICGTRRARPIAAPTGACGDQLRLRPLPQIFGDDGRVEAGPRLLLVADLLPIDRVGEQVIDLAAGQRRAPCTRPVENWWRFERSPSRATSLTTAARQPWRSYRPKRVRTTSASVSLTTSSRRIGSGWAS